MTSNNISLGSFNRLVVAHAVPVKKAKFIIIAAIRSARYRTFIWKNTNKCDMSHKTYFIVEELSPKGMWEIDTGVGKLG